MFKAKMASKQTSSRTSRKFAQGIHLNNVKFLKNQQ